MTIFGMGLDESGELLFPPLDEASFVRRLEQGLGANVAELRASASATATRSAYRLELELGPVVDLRDPLAAGWTFLVNENDPHRAAICEALRPLAEHRGMTDPARPLLFQSDADWQEWMIDNYSSVGIEQVPHYVLIAGGPDQVPFHFQALLDVAASVGRVDLSPGELRCYADKLIRLEKADAPATTKNAVIFATDAGRGRDGSWDPTYFSRKYMADPLAAYVRDQLEFQVSAVLGAEATKDRLVQALYGSRPWCTRQVMACGHPTATRSGKGSSTGRSAASARRRPGTGRNGCSPRTTYRRTSHSSKARCSSSSLASGTARRPRATSRTGSAARPTR